MPHVPTGDRRDSARSTLEQLEGRALGAARDLSLRANCLSELERHAEALVDYDAALALDPAHEGGMIWYNRGNCLRSLGRFDDAVESFREATNHRIGAVDVHVRINLAFSHADAGRIDDGIAVLDAHLAGTPRSPGLLLRKRGELLLRAGRLEEASASVERAVEAEPTVPDHLYRAGDHWLLDRRDASRAAAWYRRCLDGGHDRAAAHARLAIVALMAGDEAMAASHWRASADVDPTRDAWVPAWADPRGLGELVARLSAFM